MVMERETEHVLIYVYIYIYISHTHMYTYINQILEKAGLAIKTWFLASFREKTRLMSKTLFDQAASPQPVEKLTNT